MFLVLGIGCFDCEFVSCCSMKNGNLRGNPNKRKKEKNKDRVSLSSSFYPQIPQTPATSLTPRTHPLHEVNELMRQTHPPPATYTNVRNFRNFSRLLKKKRRRRLKIGFYFFTYEWSRRRLSLIKMIHGVEEALVLLFTAFRYEYLFCSVVVRVWIVRLFIRDKIWFGSTKKRRTANQKYMACWRKKYFERTV